MVPTTLRVRIDAGPKFATRYEGNERFDSDALDAGLGLEGDTTTRPGTSLQKLRDFYVKRGFLDVEVTRRAARRWTTARERQVVGVASGSSCSTSSSTRGCTSSRARTRASSSSDDRRPLGRRPTSPDGDRQRDRQLPRGGAARAPISSRSRPEGLDRPRSDGASPVARRRARRAARPRRPTPRSSPTPTSAPRCTCRSSIATRASSTRRSGPVQVDAPRCDPRAPPGRSASAAAATPPSDACTYDATSLPLPRMPPRLRAHVRARPRARRRVRASASARASP